MILAVIWHYFFGVLIFLTSLFLILLVLVQRGRGGGIAGALGGAGGQSAFGTKAGDLFTRITVGVATFWILLCCAAILVLKDQSFSTGVAERDAKAGAVTGIGEVATPAAGTDQQPGEGNSAVLPQGDLSQTVDQPNAGLQTSDQSAEISDGDLPTSEPTVPDTQEAVPQTESESSDEDGTTEPLNETPAVPQPEK